MEQRGVCHSVMFIGQHEDEEYESQLPSDIPKEEESSDEEEEKIIKAVFLPGIKKRKRLSLSQLREVKVESFEGQSSRKLKAKKHESRNGWSAERDMQELIAKQQQKSKTSRAEETYKEFLKWKAAIDCSLTEIMASVNGVQGKYGEFANWKTKVEQQLAEITNKLSDLKASRECPTFSPPSERWKDWIKSTNLDNIQEDELATWIGNSELPNVPQQFVIEGPNTALPTQPLSEEMTNKKSDLLELVPMRQEDQPNVTPDSSTSVNSKSDLDNSLIMCQEMFMDIFKWREKIEQQLFEVSNTVYGMLAMK